MTPDKKVHLEGPSILCGSCRFSSPLRGRFSVEDGLLVWRAEADPQPGRGPHFDFCHECGASVDSVDLGWMQREAMPAADLESLLATIDDAGEDR